MTITADELIDRYDDLVRRNPETSMRMVMWLMLYDQQPASWARDFLQDVGVLTAPTGDAEKKSQLRKVHRWRTAVEEAAGLPPRGQRGATLDYRRALNEWRRLNRRPSKEDLLAGWTPQSLPPTSGIEIEDNQAAKKSTKEEKAATTPPKEATEIKKIVEAPAPKPSINPENWNQKSPKEEEPNELLAAVDAELRPAGVLID